MDYRLSALFATSLLFGAQSAAAQTWPGPRNTPRIHQLVAVDRTGENGWPWGPEDIAGDGLGAFGTAEQAVDLRTAYAATDNTGFWIRAYVSHASDLSDSATVYAFINTDRNAGTGGPAGGGAAGTDIHEAFASDPSPGGYEYVIGIGGDGSLADVWQWQANPGGYATLNLRPSEFSTETGQDRDPVLIGNDDNGYNQGSLDLGLVGLSEACDAQLYFRSVNGNIAAGSDLVLGELSECRPVDNDNNNVPDVYEPGVCDRHEDCPADGVCVDRVCVYGVPCDTDADCAADDQCSADGWCIARASGDSCTDVNDCDQLACVGGECVACTGGSSCADDWTCGPDGRCLYGAPPGNDSNDGGITDSLALVDEDEEVQGGACTCRTIGSSSTSGYFPGLLLALALAWRRRQNVVQTSPHAK